MTEETLASRTFSKGLRRGSWIIPQVSSTFVWLLITGMAATLVCIPFIHLLMWLGDEGIWLSSANRLQSGQRLYQDFFQFHPPFGFLITEAWLANVSRSFVAARCLIVLTVVGIACFTFLACRLATGHAPAAAIVTMAWVAMSQGVWTQVNHHWFTTLFSMIAAWAMLSNVQGGAPRHWKSHLAGLAAGAASMVTPTRGGLVVLACTVVLFGLQRPSRGVWSFLAGAAVVPLTMLVYLLVQGTIVDAFQDIIVFTATRYSGIQSVPYAASANMQTLPMAGVYPFCALAAVLLVARAGWLPFKDPLLRACLAFGVAGLVGSYPRPDIVHIGFGLPLALPMAARCAALLTQGWPACRLRLAAIFACFLALPSLVFLVSMAVLVLAAPLVQTSAGRVAFISEDGMQSLVKRVSALPPEDRVFFYPYLPLLPFLTGREQLSRYEIFVPSYTTPEQYQETCLTVMGQADWVVINLAWNDPDVLRGSFPSIPNVSPLERTKFEQALSDGFSPVSQDGLYELRRRKPSASIDHCRAESANQR